MMIEAAVMTIQIAKPEVEALIDQRLQTGGFKDAEDVVFQALEFSPPDPTTTQQPTDAPEAKNMFELFTPLRGLDIDFEAGRRTDH
jgi:hypothetical protein